MNCIGGFLVRVIKDPEQQLLIFNYIMKNRLEKYFFNNFSMLNKLLYVFEKLLNDQHRYFFDHLTKSKVETDYYCSAAFLTIFTNFLQIEQNFEVITTIFDIFIAEGFIGIFKIIIYLSKINIVTIIDIKADELLTFMGKEFHDPLKELDLKSFKRDLQGISITRQQVTRLENEYTRSILLIFDYWDKYFNRKKKEARAFSQNI